MSAQEFESLKAFKSWVLENKNKLWQYNYLTDKFQKKSQGNIFTPEEGQIYIKPLSDTHINVYYFIRLVPDGMSWFQDYLIEFYHCQLFKKLTTDLRISYISDETEYWNRYFKGKPNLFVYNPNSFNFLNWNQDPFEVKS